MKHYITILFFSICFPFISNGQHSLESDLNMYRVDDVIIKQQVEYKDPGRSGGNVLWDFSRLDMINEEYELFYSLTDPNPLLEERGEALDTRVYTTGNEHLTRYHYTLEGDSLLLWGFDNSTTRIKNFQPELQMVFPVSYGSKSKDYYYGHGIYGNRLELDAMGYSETHADAYGMMILPSKDTLNRVIRVHNIKYLSEDMNPVTREYREKHDNPPYLTPDSINHRLSTDSVIFVVETFRWYQRGYRYPVFEAVRSWEQHLDGRENEFLLTSFFYPPQDHYYLEDDEANLALLDDDETNPDPWAGLTYNIYPNPVKTGLEIEFYLPRTVGNLKVQVRSTMGTIMLDKSYGSYPEGVCRISEDASGFPLGNYILDIWLDDKLINEVIMKR